MERFLRALSLLVVGLVFLPAISGGDSFPLSTHPMYASVRSTTAEFVTAVGITAEGEVRLSIKEIANTDDPLVAEERTRRTDPDDLCNQIAQRTETNVVRVVVRLETYALAARDDGPLRSEELATCEVTR